MALAVDSSRASSSYWTVPLARAAVALAAGLVITFSADHSPRLGLLVFGGFALASGLLAGLQNARLLPASAPRSALLGSAAASIIAGAVALVATANGLGFFVFLVSVWAAITGFLEIFAGVLLRRDSARAALARDWITVGIGTAVLAVLFALLPPHPVVSVGILGAYGIVLGVFLGIAAFSLKWSATDAVSSARSTEGGTR